MRFKLRNVLIVTVIVFILPIIWLTLYNERGHREYADGLEKRFADLRDRLQYAEALNRQREDDLFNLRSQLNFLLRSMAENASASSQLEQTYPGLNCYFQNHSNPHVSGAIHLPGIFNYLPHLVGRPNSLVPSHSISQGRHGVSVVIGIPTVRRESVSYVAQTIDSLIKGMSPEEQDDCLLILFVAEPWNDEFSVFVMEQIKKGFPEAVTSGLLEVIVPPPGFYPNLSSLRETFGDTQERVKWRSKQNLDYSFLMLYARSRGVYYVQLEDDVVAKPGYLTVMKSFAHLQKSNDWLLLEFSTLGFIGKMFKSADLPFVVEFFLMFYADKPIDWLLDHLLWVKVCNPEKDNKHCTRMKQAIKPRYKPSLFQHIGVKSSLKGKVQKLKDKDFGKNGLARAHMNPPAQLATTLKTFQKYTLLKAYTGETFFWGLAPGVDDVVDFKFHPAIFVERFLFRSGNPEHPTDIFHDTTVEVHPEHYPEDNIVGLPLLELKESVNQPSEGFLTVGQFDGEGLAQGTVPPAIGPVDVVRLHVHVQNPNWVILSEIMIQQIEEEKE
ncbi:alpha-1,3-mannosyl-glycoprotein 4-beta-N-acetylglucosaminyltransferase B-like [Pomacea canaliculata]|nr:alpha-1,3-mannosyl-glycoprotein 4-beta-N-acetylglucosaminyltransferase B-like [Pomacea canaliculata]XP_025088479.1 alpha-1,3-mannosyl-glycoprotein 4-beta-N-acetylglucosaminyltransferase B-like [Pomacea canaliculata]XP_025088480.1 alpha-1,3-mannosyl-glycoprotein 4-beta-N-acetylglucosaminyltransferase B-like [Pomacea canaliculata]